MWAGNQEFGLSFQLSDWPNFSSSSPLSLASPALTQQEGEKEALSATIGCVHTPIGGN
jgi:hypothetical protein